MNAAKNHEATRLQTELADAMDAAFDVFVRVNDVVAMDASDVLKAFLISFGRRFHHRPLNLTGEQN